MNLRLYTYSFLGPVILLFAECCRIVESDMVQTARFSSNPK